MAVRSLLGGRRAPLLAAAVSGSMLLATPKRALHAEAPVSEQHEAKRRPIYDDFSPANLPSPPDASSTSGSSSSTRPRPTDRLAHQIGHARLFIHRGAAAGEDWLNSTLARGLDLESSFTRTIANLTPEPATGEQILPGALYVAVATMAGSILVRRRNILLRAITPLAAGIGAGWILLPHTMRNVSDLVWKYEERVPVVAMNHLRARGFAEQGWREARDRGQRFNAWSEAQAAQARETVEEWVRKGR